MRRLTEAFGVPGYEDEIRSVIRDEIAGLVDEMRVDALGNLVALRRGAGGGKRVMLAAHMDQIGLIINYVDQKGYLRFAPLGYLFPLATWGNQVRFQDGAIGTIGLDARVDPNKGIPALADMLVDVGATGREEVRQQVGDVATFSRPFVAQGNAWFSPSMDDRIGCAIVVELLRRLAGPFGPVSHDVYAVFTTQEEVGARGAMTSAYSIQPEVALAVDVTMTGDLPHARPAMDVYLGRGAAIKVQDRGMIGHPGLNRLLIAAAAAASVPYQLEVLQAGTTDAASIQMSREGVPASAVSVPSRHVHTPSQIVDRRDVEAAITLLASFLGRPIEL
jgi:endoglucanase